MKGKDGLKDWKKFKKTMALTGSKDLDIDDDDISNSEGEESDNDIPESLRNQMGGKRNKRKLKDLDASIPPKGRGDDGDDGDKQTNGPKARLIQACLSSVAGDAKDKVMNKAQKLHSMLLGEMKTATGPLKKKIQGIAAKIATKIGDQKSSGMVKLLQDGAKCYEQMTKTKTKTKTK